MKIKNIVLMICLVATLGKVNAQQGVNYNQYGIVSVPINNAGAFLHQYGEVNLIGKQQWVGLDGAPESYRLSGSLPLGNKGLIVGLNLGYDRVAIERTSEAVAFIGKSLQLSNNNYLGLTIGLGVNHYKGNFSAIDPTDPAFSNDAQETSGLFSIGLMFYKANKYYAGISAPRIAFSQLGLSSVDEQRNLQQWYHFTGGVLFHVNDDIDIKPATLLTYSKGIKLQGDFSTIFYLKKTIGLGANVRTTGDLAAMAQFHIGKLSLGYNYQFSTSNESITSGINNNTHEITLGFRLGNSLSLL